MTTKFISSVLFMFAVTVLIFSTNSDDPLFLFISNNIVVSTARIILVGAVLAASLANYIQQSYIRTGMKIAGSFLISFGLIGLFSTPVEGALYDYLKPLDVLLALELGITMNLIALTAPVRVKGKKALPELHLPTIARLRSRLS